MSLFVLDTDILTLYAEGHAAVERHVLAHGPTEVATTVLTVEEQLSGWYALIRHARRPDELVAAYELLAQAVRFISRLPILDFTHGALTRFDDLQRLKLKIGTMDLRIAATTLEHGGVLVTRNVRDFSRVPGLIIEDWTV